MASTRYVNCLAQPIRIKFDHVLELLLISHHGRVALLRASNKVMLSLLFIGLSSLINTVEVFMKVMNGLVITLEEDKRFLCVWLFYCVSNFAESRTELQRYRCLTFANCSLQMVDTDKIYIRSYFMGSFFCFSVFSSSEVLSKIASIRSKLPTAACWSREEMRGNYEANLL